MATSKKTPTFTSPKGIALYPRIVKPDVKFKQDGEYKVDLQLSPEAAAPIIAQVDAALTEFRDADLKRLREDKNPKAKPALKKREAATIYKPYRHALDSEGNETQDIIVRFKQNAVARPKDKDPIHFTIRLFDAKGQSITKAPNVYSGSELKVNYSINTFWNAAKEQYGVQLRFGAVQIIKLVEGTGGGNAGDFGFGEEEGYVQPEGETFGSEGEGSGSGDSEAAASGDY